VNRTTDQGLVEGIIPMTPVQAAFFQSGMIDKHHFNQSVLLYSREPLSAAGLTAALDKLVLHHDALRIVYRESDAGWIQENKGASQGYTLEIIEDDQFITHCERIQSTINLTDGPLFRVALFRGAAGDRLMMVAHHLVVDAVSWRIIFEDLSDLYQQYLAGQSLHLPLKTDSFKYWQEKQSAYALSETLQAEDKYWSSIESLMIEPIPVDYPDGSNSMKDIVSSAFTLDEETTTRLLTKCYKAYHSEINDILLTGLSLALNDVFNLDNVLVRLEGHGREDIGTETDITRTVGWFTTTYPVVFDMRYSDDITRQLIEVKESLHRVPNKGIGYGILRYLGGKPYTLNPQISFNYLGDFGSGVETKQGDQIFEFSGEYHGKGFSENMQREGILEISGKVVQGRMRLAIGYSKQQYDAATVRDLADACQQRLEALIEVLSTEAGVHLSPVDLTYKDLSIDQLEKLNKLLC
jgi:non-ribosomal peptide synthase protein (TIGR01720 family)